MNKRIVAIILVGAGLIAGFFYLLYLRPAPRPATTPVDAPAVKAAAQASQEKLLVIGIDGLTWDVMLELVNAGRLPNLAGLIQRGATGKLRADEPLISPAIFTDFATGVPREVHGIDNGFAKLPFEYQEEAMGPRHRRAPAVWLLADRFGKKVGVVNWSATRPAERLKQGLIVSDGTLDPAKASAAEVWPAEWIEKVRALAPPSLPSHEAYLEQLNDPLARRAYEQDRRVFGLALEVLRELRPDLMLVAFQNLDVLSKSFWKFRYPVSLDAQFTVSIEERDRYRDVIEKQYELTDQIVGGLLAEAKGYQAIVVSDHGLGPIYPAHGYYLDFNKLLKRLGYLSFSENDCDDVIASLLKAEQMTLPAPQAETAFKLCLELEAVARGHLDAGKPRDELAPSLDGYLAAHHQLKAPKNDHELEERIKAMEALAAYLLPGRAPAEIDYALTVAWNGRDFHQKVQGIHLNVKDREPEGLVKPEDYNATRRELVKELKSLRTEDKLRLFNRVEANPAKQLTPYDLADPPDVLVEVNRDALLQRRAYRGLSDPDPIPIDALRWTYGNVSAEHLPGGVLIVAGDQVAPGVTIEATSLDLAPTLLWLLGLPLGADMTGRPLTPLFKPPLANRAPLYIDSWAHALEAAPASD